MLDLGTVRPGSTIRIPFSSFDKDDGSSITMTNYAVGDILVYKDGSTTERASTNGYTATTDFDSKTGKHLAIIDLADNTTAGFWNAGSEYIVAIDAVTVDAVTTGGWIARFRIGYQGAMFDTTIATLSTQTSFTLTAGPAEDDAINGCTVIIHDIASAVQCGLGIVSDYTGSSKTVTLAAGTTFTAAAGDNISIMFPQPLQPTVAGRTLDVSSGGEAGIDWANVGSQSTSVNLSATTTNVVNTASAVTTVNGLANNVITASAINSGAITSAKFAAGAITATVIATDAIDADALAADAVSEIQSGLATASALATVDGVVDAILVDTAEIGAAGAGLTALASAANLATVDTVVDAIKVTTDKLDDTLEDDGGTYRFTSNALEQAPSGGLDAAGVRAAVGLASANLDTQLGTIDTVVDAVKAKTDSLTFTVSGAVDANITHVIADAVQENGANDTEWGGTP